MKIKIEYESETLLPKEIDDSINKMRKNIQDNKYEADKIYCYIMNMRGDIIRWIDKNKNKS